jgi:hypothetical protein
MDTSVYSGLSLRQHNILADHNLPRQSQRDSEYPFEDYDATEEQYTRQLALLHKEHMEYFFHGLFTTEDFMPKTVQDVYYSNVYALSWFYDDVYPFDSYEFQKDSFLFQLCFEKMIEDAVDVEFVQYIDLL